MKGGWTGILWNINKKNLESSVHPLSLCIFEAFHAGKMGIKFVEMVVISKI